MFRFLKPITLGDTGDKISASIIVGKVKEIEALHGFIFAFIKVNISQKHKSQSNGNCLKLSATVKIKQSSAIKIVIRGNQIQQKIQDIDYVQNPILDALQYLQTNINHCINQE